MTAVIAVTHCNKKTMNDSYFIDCVINGDALRGCVDSGCRAVIMRQCDAIKLALKQEAQRILDYVALVEVL